MSDLYLHLRTRLEAVAEWRTLGSELMGDAQKALGLSDERFARQIPVATRTWIRWKKRGQVPLQSLDRVAELLQLEIEWPERQRVLVTDGAGDGDRLARLERQGEAVLETVQEIRKLVADLQARRAAGEG